MRGGRRWCRWRRRVWRVVGLGVRVRVRVGLGGKGEKWGWWGKRGKKG